MPLSRLAPLIPGDSRFVKLFLQFYERHHVAIRSAVAQTDKEAILLLGPEPPWNDSLAELQALGQDQWEPYFRELYQRARRYAERGGGVPRWLAASQVLRAAVVSQRPHDASDEGVTNGDASSIYLGMGQVLDYITAAIAQVPSALAEAEPNYVDEPFRLAFQAAPTGIIMVDPQGRIGFANTETERLFGYSLTELIGQPIELLVPPSARDAHHQHRADYGKAPASRTMGAGRELHARRKDGSEFPVEIGLNPSWIRGDLSVLAVVADITERKRTQEALVTKMWELQRSNEDLEQFAYVASHDLQEPLRMVVSYTTLLADRYRGKIDEKADKYIRYAVEGAIRMQQLVADLLAYSRVGSQGKPPRPVSAQLVLNRTIEGMRTMIGEVGAEIVCEPLPTVNADELQLAQLFQNLLSNALKFRTERPAKIRIEAKPKDGKWLFSVTDNGIGIAKEHCERIFHMFQRLHERGKYEGSGIGLAIAKKIVERHRGRIWFESQPGDGTTFFFTMPGVALEHG